MIQNKITLFPLSSILIDRASRQRSDLPRILDLALDIAQSQWINPILIDESSSRLIAGERRCRAVTLLHQASLYKLPEEFTSSTSPELLNRLRASCKCRAPSLENWAKIPAQLGRDISPIELMLFEFKENASREDLSWQDRAKAIFQIHEAFLTNPAADLKTRSGWTTAHTARFLGIDSTTVCDSLQAWRAFTSGDEKLARIIRDSTGLGPAILALRRVRDRREGPLVLTTAPAKGLDVAKPSTETTTTATFTNGELTDLEITPVSLGSSAILNTDFHTWAASYSGPPFNFLHLDPPYGIEFNRSGKTGSQNSAIDTRMLGEYDDSEEVFWAILHTLDKYQEKLIAPSAHLMLWYSQNHDWQTMNLLDGAFPRAWRWTHRLIWHCSDNAGLLPDPQRSGRRTYETAFVLSFGDRLLAKPKALSVAHPRENSVHRSQKPLAVLSPFFEMFVDETSLVLDPTCGSGTALIAAHKLGAKQVLGIEIDPETHQRAVEYFDKEVK